MFLGFPFVPLVHSWSQYIKGNPVGRFFKFGTNGVHPKCASMFPPLAYLLGVRPSHRGRVKRCNKQPARREEKSGGGRRGWEM